MAIVQSEEPSSESPGQSALDPGPVAKTAFEETSNTGERDENFNLISVLYHALQAAEACTKYVQDAEAAGDEQLAQFLEEARGSQIELAQQAKELLADRLGVGALEDER